MHKALHHLLVGGDVGVQEFENQAFVDHGVFHQQHRAKRALADFLDIAVPAFDYIAGFQRGNVESCITFVFRDNLGNLLGFDQQRFRRFLEFFCLFPSRHHRWRIAIVQIMHRIVNRALDGFVTELRLAVQLRSNRVGAFFVGEP